LPRVLATAGLAALLGGCVGVQVPKLPAGDLPAQWHNSPKLGARPDLTGWWKHFRDPQLDALVERALRDNPGIAGAAWKLRAARALEDASAARFKPHANFGTLEQPNPENTANYFQAGFDATWEFGLFGRSGASAHIASANSGAAAAELQSARVSLVAEVAREYLQLRAAQRDRALLQSAAQTAQRTVQLLSVREHLQMASRLDVAHARAAAAAADARLAGTGAAISQHAQTLALLLGTSEPNPAWLAPAPLPQLHAGDVSALPADLLRTRPEIRYAQAQVLKAAGELGIAKAALYPRLALASSLSFSALVTGHTKLGGVNDTFAIGPIIDIPLFDRGQRRAVRDARADQLQAALLTYRQAVLQGAAEVETSLANLHASKQRLRAADAAVAATQQGVRLSETLQGLGQADAIEIDHASAASIDAEVTLNQARLAHALAYVALYKALGGAPLPPAGHASATAPGISPGRDPHP
jgi:NodT family efflux transporter outer membrane factor (OMF) lipoprotein